jgi:homoserine O-succinyltransferase
VPFLRDTAQSDFAIALRGGNCINIALINNMPDAAFEVTERQFVEVIRAVTNNAIIRLKLFSIPDVPRADHVRHTLAQRYRDVSQLWNTQVDGLIVTGTEPHAASLKDEPYWARLTEVIDWARENTISTIWSCLAAHAAVLRADGIERHRLPNKQFGVFDCQVAAHPMMHNVRGSLRVPHSRYNDLAEQPLTGCGYKILTRSTVAGVDTFSKHERSFFLFFQGHPEYDSDTLLREYRRDIRRFLRGEQQHYPANPHGYFSDAQTVIANKFRDHALVDRRDELIDSFPMTSLEVGHESTWRTKSIEIYRNWIGYLRARKAEEQVSTVLVRQTWRDSPRRPPRLKATVLRS